MTFCVTVTWWWLLWVPLGFLALMLVFAVLAMLFMPGFN